jgi:hypothetical protein
MWLYLAAFGAVAAIALAVPAGPDVIAAMFRQLALAQNPVVDTGLALLLVALAAMALSTMSAGLAAGLCTLRYDILPTIRPAPAAARPGFAAAGGLLVAVVAVYFLADAFIRIEFASTAFLALLFACGAIPLSFSPLVLVALIESGRTGAVAPGWALAAMASGVAGTACALAVHVATGAEAWLWAAVPACLGASLLVFAVACLRRRREPR